MKATLVPQAGKVATAAPPHPLETTEQQQLEGRRVTVDTCRTIVQQSDLSDQEAQEIIEHLYLFAEVATDAFIELRCDHLKNTDEPQLESEAVTNADLSA